MLFIEDLKKSLYIHVLICISFITNNSFLMVSYLHFNVCYPLMTSANLKKTYLDTNLLLNGYKMLHLFMIISISLLIFIRF